jgi:hypothetical protein
MAPYLPHHHVVIKTYLVLTPENKEQDMLGLLVIRPSLFNSTRLVSHTQITSRNNSIGWSVPFLSAPSNAVKMQIPQRNRKIGWMHVSDASLEHGDVVADPVFLVLRDALGDPGNVADFL